MVYCQDMSDTFHGITRCFTGFLCFFISTGSIAANSFDYEFDPYYTNAGYFISLTEEPIPEVSSSDELDIYDRLWDSAFSKPRFVLIEASINPLPILGTALKRNYPEQYDSAEILGGDVNLIQTLTEGFEEPWALSLFIGSVVQFTREGSETKAKNKGYSGFLFSTGRKHIVNNNPVDDEWFEMEWKIKGDREFGDKTLSWSFRAGAKTHQNVNIADTLYFGIRRNHLDKESDDIDWFDNSDIEYKIDLNRENYTISQQSLFINKKWPSLISGRTVFELGVGFILENAKYTGTLATQDENFRLIIRPSFSF